jgi:pyruvate/2-oxoglutarate dehydrogenase complex dihydrolipoamide dehydrogenase (E3) component
MSQPERFDVLVLGSGAGGKLIAWQMAKSGRRTAVVERRWIGGSCPNVACLPSKNEIRSAQVAHLARHGAQFGTMTGPVAVDMATVRRRKRDMVEDQIAAHLQNYKASVRTTSGEQTIEGSDILVAVGRVPNTAGIGLTEAGVELDSRGYIRVNERLETSASKVWAIGECAGSPQFTHVSEDDFRIIRDNLAGGKRSTRDRLVPYCMFTDPPLAHVGLSEREAERQGVIARVARLPTSAVLRAQATGEKQGFMKALVGENDDRILGFTMIGAEAGEVMAVVQTAMLADLPFAAPRRRSRAPDHGGGPRFSVLERSPSIRATCHAEKRVDTRIMKAPVAERISPFRRQGAARLQPLRLGVPRMRLLGGSITSSKFCVKHRGGGTLRFRHYRALSRKPTQRMLKTGSCEFATISAT